ncbi:MAG: hypothetical protein RLZZ81_1035 [Pseudomonadota bacterium]|jgi:alanyl-tRNA synthetase
MTIQLYLNNTYLFESQASILNYEEDEKGKFIILDQTIFYPQGGGQPSDQGLIQNDHFEANITLVRQVGLEIRHYINTTSSEIPINSIVNCFLDQNRRVLNSRYHTAAHLLGNLVEVLYPMLKAIKGHSFPKEAYVEFQGDETVDIVQIQNIIDETIAQNNKTQIFETDLTSFEQQFYKLPYNVPENKKFRVMRIGDMLPVPCGGTHLSSIAEVGKVLIGKIKLKNNIIRISYEVI